MRKLQKTLGRRKATIKTGKHPFPNYKISVHGFGQKIKKLKKKGIICDANTLHCGTSAQNFNQPFPGSVSIVVERVCFADYGAFEMCILLFQNCYPSQFALAYNFQNSFLEISYKILNF